jgi:hypothetical protein
MRWAALYSFGSTELDECKLGRSKMEQFNDVLDYRTLPSEDISARTSPK